MSFKLRYTTAEIMEHLRNRASYWQGQIEESKRRIKTLEKCLADYKLKEAEKIRTESDQEREDRVRYGGGLTIGMYFSSEVTRESTITARCETSLSHIRLLQSHLPDREFHDLDFADLRNLEIE